jgi:hypothetical protein
MAKVLLLFVSRHPKEEGELDGKESLPHAEKAENYKLNWIKHFE